MSKKVEKDECIRLELTVEHLLDIYEDDVRSLINDIVQLFSLYEVREKKYDEESKRLFIEIC